ncbi:hypothetical protein GCM10027047_35140 [Rhodococcus aerolatus]
MTASTTPPPTAEGHARREQLRTRNARLRGEVDARMADLTRQVDELARAQQQAAAVTGEGTSADGLVRVLVNAAGVVLSAEVRPGAYERVSPQALGRDVVQASQAAARDARRQVEDVMAPTRRDTPDLTELVPGAPSLRDLLPPVPEPPTTPPPTAGPAPAVMDLAPAAAPPAPRRAPRPTWDDDDAGPLLRGAGS